MKTAKELNEKDLDSVSGGETDLDKYFKSLVGEDKNKILVDYGTGVQLDIDPSVQRENDENLIIIKREKSTPEE